jgi:hypothetical protein
MSSQRIAVTHAVRFKVLTNSKFKCVYCGATPSEAKLEIDHVLPVSRGGTNDIDNLVAACFRCNRGKRDKLIQFSPRAMQATVPHEAWEAQRRCDDLLSAWRCALGLWWPEVDSSPETSVGSFSGEVFPFTPTFVCRGRESDDIGPEVRVLVTRWRELGSFNLEEQTRIRNAVISGYDVPTMILMGPPWFFFGVLINERHKGCPYGRVIDGFLQPFETWEGSGWYPDESLDFEDLRVPFLHTPRELQARQWDAEAERFFGVYSVLFSEEG